MSRTLDSAIVAVLDDELLRPVHFASIVFDDGTVYLHDDLGTITFGGHSYLGVGDFGSVTGMEEREDGSPAGVVLHLSAIDTGLLNEVLTENFFRRAVTVYIGFRNLTTGLMVADPAEMFHGYIDDMSVNAGKLSSIEVAVETELQAWDRPLNRYFSDSENQRVYPGKLGAKYMAAMATHKVTLGNKTVVNVSDTFRK